MASSNSKGQLTGSIGPIYYRTYNGKTIAQTKPGKKRMRQSAATKTSASEFGSVSSAARLIRLGLAPLHRSMTDGQMVNRFNKRLYEAVLVNTTVPKGERSIMTAELSMLSGFDFNAASPFSRYCQVVPEIELHSDRSITLSTEAFSTSGAVLFPDGSDQAEISMLVCTFDPADWSRSSAGLFRIDISGHFSQIAARQWTSAPLPEGHLIIIATTIVYFVNDGLMGRLSLNNREMNPCVLTAAFRSA